MAKNQPPYAEGTTFVTSPALDSANYSAGRSITGLNDRNEWEKRKVSDSASVGHNEGNIGLITDSVITDVAFDRSPLTWDHVGCILSTLRKLVRFRWTHELFWSFKSDESKRMNLPIDEARYPILYNVNRGIREILTPHKGNLKELDLRLDHHTCCPNYIPDFLVHHLNSQRIISIPYSFVDFQVMTTLTIDPAALCGRPAGHLIERNIEELLPKSLEYLGLVYPLGHWHDSCQCPQIIRKQTWTEEVLNFARTLPTSLPLLAEVQLISVDKGYSAEDELEERNRILETAKRAFHGKGIVCSVSNVTPLTPLPNFRTAGQ
ncbi:hypothetical protein NHQ30_006276 [Ciborinia camelliae]|nr:hypothetical protein NHQ30_006276 [Ciborinia camelliae]